MFLRGLYRAEQTIAERLRTLAQGSSAWPSIDADKAIPWVEARTGKTLAASQRAAVGTVLASKVGRDHRRPRRRQDHAGRRHPAHPGRQGTKLPARGAHRSRGEADIRTDGPRGEDHPPPAGDRPEDRRVPPDDDNPLDCDLLVVDETSMVDVLLMRSLLRAVPDEAALFLVGDVDQLPSVGPGQVLADIIASGVDPGRPPDGGVPAGGGQPDHCQCSPDQPRRDARMANAGALSDFYFIDAEEPEDGVAKIIEVVRDRIPRRFGLDPIRDVQVLCPMNRGGLGARSLNVELQKALNPPAETVERFGWTFAPGDKVMQIENDYDREVYNGDLGLVRRIDEDEGELVVAFDGREVEYPFGELDALVPAYATTIHKSQGSEYPAVVITLATQHYTMLARNLVYTAVTRGKRLVVIVGQRKALAIAVRTHGRKRRWTKLREWLSAH